MAAPLILLASARSDGRTAEAAALLAAALPSSATIDLLGQPLRDFDYARVAEDDDALRGLVRHMAEAPAVIFATPVYWYAMSAVLKRFLDRLSDLLHHPHSRPLGRALAGRPFALIATGTDPELPDGFTVPFARTAAYFGCGWLGGCYVQVKDDALPVDAGQAIADFAGRIVAQLGDP